LGIFGFVDWAREPIGKAAHAKGFNFRGGMYCAINITFLQPLKALAEIGINNAVVILDEFDQGLSDLRLDGKVLV